MPQTRANYLYDDEPEVLPGLESVATRNARRRAENRATLDEHTLPIQNVFDKLIPEEKGGF